MVDATAGPPPTSGIATAAVGIVGLLDGPLDPQRRNRVVQDERLPPQRSLADFIPDMANRGEASGQRSTEPVLSSVMAKCPVCGIFEGDEAAVSHHVESHFR